MACYRRLATQYGGRTSSALALGIAAALLMPLLHLTLSSPTAQPTPRNDFQHAREPLADSTPSERVAPAAELRTQHLQADVEALPAWPRWLALAWAIGALLVALRFGKAYLAAHRLSRDAQPADAATWFAAHHDAANALALKRIVALGRSTEIQSPMTVGVLRPRILLPAAADDWSPERLHAGVSPRTWAYSSSRHTDSAGCSTGVCAVLVAPTTLACRGALAQ